MRRLCGNEICRERVCRCNLVQILIQLRQLQCRQYSIYIYICNHTRLFLPAGPNCDVNMTTKYDAITCPQDFCRPPSVCVPLIRGGFRCDGCPDDGNYDEFCRLKTRSFRRGSYMTFPSLKTRNRFTIRLRSVLKSYTCVLFSCCSVGDTKCNVGVCQL